MIKHGEQLRLTAVAIVRLVKRVPVVAFVNNHHAGYAPETVRQLRFALDELR